MKEFFIIPNSDNINPEVVKHFRRNFFANIMDSGFWFFGDSFVAAYTIMPVFMSTLTDSPILIGLIPALEGAGWFLPQLFLAKHLEGQNRRLPLVLKLGVLDRLPLLFLAIGALFILKVDPTVAVIMFLLIYIVKTFSSGFGALPWQELIATVIPITHRGRYWGIALILGKLMGMVGAIITGFLLTSIAYPTNYAAMFGVGFIGVSISLLFVNMNIEPEIERSLSPANKKLNLWARMGKILRADSNFSNFLINRGFMFLSSMGLGFVTVYGIQEFDLPLSHSAIFTFIMLVTEVVGYSIWGAYGDKNGYKKILEFNNLFLILGLVILLLSKSIWGLYFAFVIMSFSHAGEYLADQNIAMEFSSEEDRPTYIGMSKTLTGPFLLLAPIIGGTFVQLWGYQIMFLTALATALIAFGTIRFFVKEPRLST
ncbi:MAG: MFS transporter [Chloroflexi bacterium]|nr:MFS transporter [Chloroflexota bacterium]